MTAFLAFLLMTIHVLGILACCPPSPPERDVASIPPKWGLPVVTHYYKLGVYGEASRTSFAIMLPQFCLDSADR